MADVVETSFDVSLQYPARRIPLRQPDVALVDGIGATPIQAKPVGIGIARGLSHRLQGQRIKRLRGAVVHGGNTQRAHLAVLLRYVHPAQWLGSITATAQGLYSSHSLLRRVPDCSVYAGGFSASV